MHKSKHVAFLVLLLILLLPSLPLLAQQETTGSAGGQTWTIDTLPNGLHVIYAPMPTSPTTHVRVLYHVGSRDEQSNRQGFAHMFEHMMFRGSAHVAPQVHMKLISLVGGFSNAFTSFDETVYHDTLPASYTELALWLEADRMASFKVSQQIFSTERQVVAEEWRMRLNQPYGGMFDQLMPTIFRVHPYHWTPIGNMDHLNAAKVDDLQNFFNKFYGPNNAILVIAGNIDVAKTKEQVNKYFAWIPPRGITPGSDLVVPRSLPTEPAQTEPRRLEVKMTAPLARVFLAYRMPRDDSDDMDPLELLLSVAGDGESSRLFKALVTTDDPLCVDAGSVEEPLEDGGVMGFMGTVLNGKNPADVEKVMRQQIAELRDHSVSAAELEKVKQQQRLAIAERFATAEDVGTVLGDEMLSRHNLDRIPTARARLEAITPADLQRMAQKYLQDNGVTTMIITPGSPQDAAAAAAAAQNAPAPALTNLAAPATGPASAPAPAAVVFPAGYPTQPPLSGKLPAATFAKGVETDMPLPRGRSGALQQLPKPVRVIVMEDHRMPIVNWSFTLHFGGHREPVGKEGVASLTADMIRRGPKGTTFDQFNDDLETRAISLDVSDGGDRTDISGSCLKEQFPYALNLTKKMLQSPAFDEGEFRRSKNQSLASLQLALDGGQTLASRALTQALYAESPLGRLTTIKSLSSVSLDDVKTFYKIYAATDDAILMLSGDITPAEGQAAAKDFLGGFFAGTLPPVEYKFPDSPTARHIILVDHPDAKQAAIRIGIPAYSIRSDEKFTGTLANQILSNGIDSRLGQYVRAEKGYVYGVQAIFSPNREAGAFVGETDTKFETAADTVLAMFKVFDDMKNQAVPASELADAKFRVAGQLLMSMETTQEQAAQRISGILNNYPIDYYDKYADRVAPVTSEELKTLMNKYVDENRMTIVVVGPAEVLKAQLEKLGTVEVVKDDAGQ